MATKYKAGDRVKVKPGKEHDDMTKGKSGTVQEIQTEALGIKFDGMSEMHKWYVDDELDADESPAPPDNKGGKKMNRIRRYDDKAAARAAWRARFENRTVGERAAKTVEIRAAADDTTEILLMDEIGFWGITARDFIEKLSGVTTGKIVVRINSPGGDVFDGLAIYNALRSHAAEVSTVVEGLAASAASFIALAGDNVRIHDSAMMMIHRAWGLAIGNEGDMTDMAKTLQKIDGQLAGIYAKKTGKGAGEMLALMSGESDGTWFTAAEAVDLGLADEVIDDPREGDAETKAMMARVSAMRRRLALAEQD